MATNISTLLLHTRKHYVYKNKYLTIFYFRVNTQSIYILTGSVPNFKLFRPFRYIVFTTNLDITHARLSTLQELIKFLVKLKRLNYKLDRGST